MSSINKGDSTPFHKIYIISYSLILINYINIKDIIICSDFITPTAVSIFGDFNN